MNTGGPAFPVPDTYHPNGQVQYGTHGMTLLDWYAGQALAAMVEAESKESHKQLTNDGYGSEATYFTRGFADEDYWDGAAKASYACASAMLAEKARREAVVQESSTTDHSEDSLGKADHSPDAGKMEELQEANRELVEFAERLAAFPLEEFGWQDRKDSQPIHGWNDYTLYVSDIKRARNLVAKHKGDA